MNELSSMGLVQFVRNCLEMDTVYLPGGMGETLTLRRILLRKTVYPEHFTVGRMRTLLNRINGTCRGFDCSGLLKCYIMGGIESFRYDPEYDLNCASMFKASSQKGEIGNMPDTPGICLYMEGHTGVYAGDGKVIESTPNVLFGDGVVETKLTDRPWTHWFQLSWIKYD